MFGSSGTRRVLIGGAALVSVSTLSLLAADQGSHGFAVGALERPTAMLLSRSPGKRTGSLLQTKPVASPVVRNRPAPPAPPRPPAPTAFLAAVPLTGPPQPSGFGPEPLVPVSPLSALPGVRDLQPGFQPVLTSPVGLFPIVIGNPITGGDTIPPGGNVINPPGSGNDSAPPVPEPATWLLTSAALALIGTVLRRRADVARVT